MHVQGTVLNALVISPLKKKRRDAKNCKACVGFGHLLNDCGYQKKEIEEEL